MSAEKESFFYNDNKTFCTYNGMVFTNTNDELAVWPIDQIGKSLRENPYLDFTNFLKWLHDKS
jgi:hypothetical protein